MHIYNGSHQTNNNGYHHAALTKLIGRLKTCRPCLWHYSYAAQ